MPSAEESTVDITELKTARNLFGKSSDNPSAGFETWSSYASQPSISTQTSIYAPAFNRGNPVTSDLYDSRYDSDTSNIPQYGSRFSDRGSGVDSSGSIAGMTGNKALPADRPRSRGTQDFQYDSDHSSKGSLKGKPVKTEPSLTRYDRDGYQSDVLSVSSSSSSKLRFARLREDAMEVLSNSHSNSRASGPYERSHVETLAPLGPNFQKNRVRDVKNEQFPAVIVPADMPPFEPKTNSCSRVTPCKDRNFKFDFESDSFSSTAGVSDTRSVAFAHSEMEETYETYDKRGPRRIAASQLSVESRNLEDDSMTKASEGTRQMHRQSSALSAVSSTGTSEVDISVERGSNSQEMVMRTRRGGGDQGYHSGSNMSESSKAASEGVRKQRRQVSTASSAGRSHGVGSMEGDGSELGMVVRRRREGGVMVRSRRTVKPLERVLKGVACGRAWFLVCMPRGVCSQGAGAGRVKGGGGGSSGGDTSKEAVVTMKMLWADLHRPSSLDRFVCHTEEANLLRQLISQQNCPHILFHGPPGSGKKALIMALLREIFGPNTWKVLHERRQFIKSGEEKIVTQITTSNSHVEIDADNLGENARTILVSLIKEITKSLEHSGTLHPTTSNIGPIDFKVLVLYNADKLSRDAQQLIRWLMDRHGDLCKILLCCGDLSNMVDTVKSRCKIISIDAPSTEQIVAVLKEIAEKEEIELSPGFAGRIAAESNHNLRYAIESLEARKPSAPGQSMREDLPIPTGWEDTVVELANDIVSEQTPKRMFMARGKLQNVLDKNVPPVLVLQTLVELLMKRLDSQIIKDLLYWHDFYEKRLPSGTNAICKLEEFVAKFMSIYKKYATTSFSELDP